MRKKLFTQNLMLFLIPMLIPLLVLSTFSYILTQYYIKQQADTSNLNLLNQTKQNIELILGESDSFNLNFSYNIEHINNLEKILNKESFSLDDVSLLSATKNIIDVPANTKPYIYSIYVYLENEYGRFISTGDSLSGLYDFYDTSWFESYKASPASVNMWIESREVRQFEFEKEPARVLTIFRNIYYIGLKKIGVIVFNINSEYIINQLHNLDTLADQSILILDKNNRLILNYGDPNIIKMIDLGRTFDNTNEFFTIESGNLKYRIAQTVSDRYGLKYISIVPESTLYQLPHNLLVITVFLVIVTFFIGLSFTYYFTKKNYVLFQNILSILESAEKGQALPSFNDVPNNRYNYIIQNILKTFIKQNYMEVQLSEKKYRLQAMELKALHSQINPHFLMNTLYTLYWKVIDLTGGPNETSKMVENLSDILKYSLSNPSGVVNLREELAYTKSYVEIQKVRYREKFNVIWEYSDDLLCFNVIKLMFQPIIENSIYHGIKEKKGNGAIKIRIALDNCSLKIAVIDNGLGISRENLDIIRKKLSSDEDYSEHIGLLNVNKRIKLIFGGDYGLKINSKYGSGTALYIKLPLNSMKEQD